MAVQATLSERVAPDSSAGAFAFNVRASDGEIVGMTFKCPCGCADIGRLNFDPLKTDQPCWQWDGNREAPTLSPSVQKVGQCAWHGWLRAGDWVEA